MSHDGSPESGRNTVGIIKTYDTTAELHVSQDGKRRLNVLELPDEILCACDGTDRKVKECTAQLAELKEKRGALNKNEQRHLALRTVCRDQAERRLDRLNVGYEIFNIGLGSPHGEAMIRFDHVQMMKEDGKIHFEAIARVVGADAIMAAEEHNFTFILDPKTLYSYQDLNKVIITAIRRMHGYEKPGLNQILQAIQFNLMTDDSFLGKTLRQLMFPYL